MLYLSMLLREAAKNMSFFSGTATKRGGEVRAWPLKKRLFFEALKKIWNFFVATKLEGGDKALVAGPLKKIDFFLRLPLYMFLRNIYNYLNWP